MKTQSLLFTVGFAMIVGVFFIIMPLILTYNGLVKSDKIVDEEKAQIETVIQRRLDLIPNLVSIVKGYAQHERETLTAVTQARADAQALMGSLAAKKVLSKDDLEALSNSQTTLTGAVHKIFALAENYPDLKAAGNFFALQDQMEGTENRIAVARQRYNSAVRAYNTKVVAFPGNIIAPVFGYDERSSFEAKEEANDGIKIEF